MVDVGVVVGVSYICIRVGDVGEGVGVGVDDVGIGVRVGGRCVAV